MTYFAGFPFLVSFLLTQTLLFPTFFALSFFFFFSTKISVALLWFFKRKNK